MGSKYELENDEPVWQNVVAGILIGLVVGGAVGLLFAPKSGARFRADLADAVDDLKDKAEEIVDVLQDSAGELMVRTQKVLDETRENVVRSVEAGKEAYTQTRDELTAQLETK
ncbi:MAG: YtxH domain-containing protein [Capsulimonadales bacterium]|nr:YtxH domain-containing protein [Capsulimonadales bacterium]